MKKAKTKVSPRWAKFCGWLLRKMGWESVGGPMTEPKAIVLGVPHTSAADFLVSYLFYAQFGKVAHIMIKKEFFFWPLGPILRACGAVAVDRSNPTSLVRSLIHQMEDLDEFHLAIAPEGTRKAVKRWKTGFHLIARETGAAVYMGFFDWGRKRIGCGEKVELTEDTKADMARIYEHYRTLGLQGKNPKGYTVPETRQSYMANRIKSPYKAWRKYRNREQSCTTLHKVFDYATTHYNKRVAYQFVDGGQKYTYEQFRLKVNQLSLRMTRFGIKHGDRVAILSQNMPNWVVAFFSATVFGRVAVPILPDSSENEVTNILRHSESRVLFISKRLMPKLSEECKAKLTLIIDIESFEFLKKEQEDFKCNGWVKDPQPDDLACIIYTSGTTGNAKGVMLSHRNLCANLAASFKAKPAFTRDRFLSILPAAHAYEMGVSTIYSFYVGATCYTLQKPPTPTILLAAMKKVRPTIVCSVPLIIEKVIKNSVWPTIQKSRILSWADKHLPHILHWFIGRRIVKTFGGKLQFFGIGGAKLDPVVEKFLIDCHFPYAVGYGLTETSPLVCNVMVNKRKHLGSIGPASYRVEVRLDGVNPATGEGEIVVRGDNVMLGYYKDPERTLKVLDDEGWFHTNDVATMDKNGIYYIKGRLNNTILGPSGENIYPEEIEQVINNIEGVEESLVMERDGKLVALVKFQDNAIDWNQSKEDKWFEELEARKKSVLDWVNKTVGKNSKIGEVDAMKEPFEKTATQKIRRFKYKDRKGDEPEK